MSTRLNRRPRRVIATVLGVVLLLALGVGCVPQSEEGGPQEGGVLRIGTSSGIDSMNPFVGINQDSFAAWLHMYPSLLQYDLTVDSHDYIGSFAESWEVSEDGKTVTFHTVEDAKWSDGEALTAEDAAWSFSMIQRLNDGPTGSWSIGDTVEGFEAPDDNTLVITLSKPSATVLYDFGTTPILPPQVWEPLAEGDGKGIKPFQNVPEGDEPVVSGGPFMLVKYEKDSIALFERNPNWYGAEPKIEGFGVQMYKNEDAMITDLKSGELDAINEVPPTAVETLEEAGFEVSSGPSLALRDFIINSNPDKANHRELLMPEVRQAMEHAIDREEIVDTAWLGHATPGTTIIPPAGASEGQEWHNSTIEPLAYDIDAANEILDGLGFERGPDGVRVANGEPMSYAVIFPEDEAGAGDRAFKIIQSGFDEIGIKISQKRLDTNAAWEAIWCGDDCAYEEFDLAMWDWFPSQDPDFILGAMTCGQWGTGTTPATATRSTTPWRSSRD